MSYRKEVLDWTNYKTYDMKYINTIFLKTTFLIPFLSNSLVVDAIFRLDFMVKFEKDVCKAGNYLITIKSYFSFISEFFDVLCTIVQC